MAKSGARDIFRILRLRSLSEEETLVPLSPDAGRDWLMMSFARASMPSP